MKKGSRGEVVLSPCQIQATRLNRLEYHRLQRNVDLLKDDLEQHLTRLSRQEHSLKSHFANVVKIVKPNRAFQLWKQAHAQEIAQEEEEELVESYKRQQKLRSKSLRQTPTTSEVMPTETLRPLLLLLEDPSKKKPAEPIINFANTFLRPKSSPANKPPTPTAQRVNPLLNMLGGKSTSLTNVSQQPTPPPSSTLHRSNTLLTMIGGRPASSNVYRQQQPPTAATQQQQYDSPSFFSSTSTGTTGSRKLIQGKYVVTHKKSDLDAFYRIALQNQTAYKSVDRTRVEDRKLHDKEFASRHRALQGSMRSAGFVN